MNNNHINNSHINNNHCIGLTGPIGSGKSTVANILLESDAKLIDADLLSRQVLIPCTPKAVADFDPNLSVLSQVVVAFGTEVLDRNGQLNRKRVAEIIFDNQEAKEKLEAIMHPAIYKAYVNQRDRFLGQYSNSIIVYDAALLLSSKFQYPELELKVLVAADEEHCISRIMQRNNISSSQAILRLKNQMPLEEQVEKADWVIWNNYENLEAALPALRLDCEKLIAHIKTLSSKTENDEE